MRSFVFVLLLLAATPVAAEEPTELYDCLDDVDGPGFCTDSTAVLVERGCGATFNRYHTRIAWPVLRNVGPVTIAVKTRSLFQLYSLPLYVEVVGRTLSGDDFRCYPGLAGFLVLVAQGGVDCGGTWESVGPIDLTSYGVPFGALYNVQAVFFESIPYDDQGNVGIQSIGFSCLRVTSHPLAIASTTWSNVKVLFR
jgi:hypothetical protein